MKTKLEELLDQIDVFADSKELAGELENIADHNQKIGYYLKESAINLEGMYGLLKDIKKAIKAERKVDRKS